MTGLIRRIESSKDGEDALDRVQSAVTAVLDHRIPIDILSGRAIGHPMHPLTVQIPSGMWIAALSIDALGGRPGRRFARLLIGLGIVTSVPAVATGLTEWIHTRDAERRVGAVHAVSNVAAVAAMTSSWRARAADSGRGRGSSLVAMVLLGVGGWLGGHLAYARGVGVNTATFLKVPRTWTGVLNESDVHGGTVTAGEVDGVAVALLLAPEGVGVPAGTIIAMESRCTHRGGPLHEGNIEEDGCVSCPWHGSRFDVVTGEATRGPASIAQLVYRTRVVDGRVEIIGDDAGGLRKSVI